MTRRTPIRAVPATMFLVMATLAIPPMIVTGHAQQPAAIPATASAALPADAAFSREELTKLLAPYALYPDDLLAQLLPACAYPIEVVQVSRWLEKNKAAVAQGDFSGLDAQAWDPSVKALARFPDVLATLNDDLDRTTDIGDAFVNQPNDVAAVIQSLRQEAQRAGSLKSTPQQTVVVQSDAGANYIVIEPTEPGVIYVPTYDPATVYYGNTAAAGLIGFGVGVAVGVAASNAWDWGRGWVYPPRWPGYPGHGPGYRTGGDINIGKSVNIGNGNTVRPWRPDVDRYHPGQGSKPGINRPGGGARPPGGPPHVGPGNGPGRPGVSPPGTRLPGIARPDPPRPNPARPGNGTKPVPARPPASQIQKPAARPALPSPARETAFSGVHSGGAVNGMAQRGGASRQSVPHPGAARGGGGRAGGGGHGGGGRMHR